MKTFAWITSVVLGSITTFSVTIFYQEWYQYSELEAAAYISLHKLAWGIVNGWLIIACATGNGGKLCICFNIFLECFNYIPVTILRYCDVLHFIECIFSVLSTIFMD